MIGIFAVLLDRVPNPGLVAGLLVVVIGSALILIRIGRLGPVQGEFGSPWFESDLCEMLRREVARSARFDRDLTIAIVRQHSGRDIDWASSARAADEVVRCRNGWYVLVLPETAKNGAERLIQRVTLEAGAAVQAVVMDPSIVHNNPERMGEAILKLVRSAPEPLETPFAVRRDTDRLRWPA